MDVPFLNKHTHTHTHIENDRKNGHRLDLSAERVDMDRIVAIPSKRLSDAMYEDWKAAVHLLLDESCPRDEDDTINAACELAKVGIETARYKYLPRAASSAGPFVVYAMQGRKVIDRRNGKR